MDDQVYNGKYSNYLHAYHCHERKKQNFQYQRKNRGHSKHQLDQSSCKYSSLEFGKPYEKKQVGNARY